MDLEDRPGEEATAAPIDHVDVGGLVPDPARTPGGGDAEAAVTDDCGSGIPACELVVALATVSGGTEGGITALDDRETGERRENCGSDGACGFVTAPTMISDDGEKAAGVDEGGSGVISENHGGERAAEAAIDQGENCGPVASVVILSSRVVKSSVEDRGDSESRSNTPVNWVDRETPASVVDGGGSGSGENYGRNGASEVAAPAVISSRDEAAAAVDNGVGVVTTQAIISGAGEAVAAVDDGGSSGKKKRGRPQRGQVRAVAAKKVKVVVEEEDVCFICFDGGSLVLCDRKGCPKAYHPACVKIGEAFFQSKAKWNCGWHICSICQKAAHHMCYTCTYSLCKSCTKDADYVSVRDNKGLCVTCMKTVMLIERDIPGDKDTVRTIHASLQLDSHIRPLEKGSLETGVRSGAQQRMRHQQIRSWF